MTFLTGLPVVWLLAFTLAFVVLGSAGMVVALSRASKEGRDNAGATAAAYMTALGSLFAILTGFLINTEYSTLRHANEVVGQEAAAISQLGYASAGLPPPDAVLIQQRLATYADALATVEWSALADNRSESSPAFAGLAGLQAQVVRLGSEEYPPPDAVASMRDALQDLTQTRRERIAIASQGLPAALFALSVIAGLALIANAIIVAMRAGHRYAYVAIGIIVLVALDLAAILAISAPFRGPFQASTAPLAGVAQELRDSAYLPWVRK